MALRRVIPTASLLAILLLALIVTLPVGKRVGAVASVAIIVYDHGLAKGVVYGRHTIPVNKTYSFTEDDPFAYAYFSAAVSSANVTWLWYDPNGLLYTNSTQEISCDSSPCTYIYYFRIQGTAAMEKFGVWTVTLEAGGVDLYSDQFTISPVIYQDNSWTFDITQSAPLRGHGSVTVTLHPPNETWSSYSVNLPFAANVTAYDLTTNQSLQVAYYNATRRTIVDLGAPRPDGYQFVVRFDLAYGVWSMGTWNSGYYAFGWRESSWEFDQYHPLPSTFNVTLPNGSNLVDTVGINNIALNGNATASPRPTLSFVYTLPPMQSFGWVILYRDIVYPNTNPPSPASPLGLSAAQAQPIPFLPMTVGSFSVWSAIMSILLLTGSELLSPVYARTGVLIDRRRLRIVAVVLVFLFLAATTYQVILISQPVTPAGH